MITQLLEFLGLATADVPDSLLFTVSSCFVLLGLTEFFRLVDILMDKATKK